MKIYFISKENYVAKRDAAFTLQDYLAVKAQLGHPVSGAVLPSVIRNYKHTQCQVRVEYEWVLNNIPSESLCYTRPDIDVIVAENFLSRYADTKISAKRGDRGEILGEVEVKYTIDEAAVLSAWLADGCPLRWGFEDSESTDPDA